MSNQFPDHRLMTARVLSEHILEMRQTIAVLVPVVLTHPDRSEAVDAIKEALSV